MPKKNTLGVSNIHSDAKQWRNWRGDPLGKKFSEKKSRSAGNIEKGDPLVSPGMVCYAEKQEKPFWFSSLGQMMQFGAILFCRTFKNSFGQFVWIEKKSHYNSRVSLHEAPTKKYIHLWNASKSIGSNKTEVGDICSESCPEKIPAEKYFLGLVVTEELPLPRGVSEQVTQNMFGILCSLIHNVILCNSVCIAHVFFLLLSLGLCDFCNNGRVTP